MISRRGFLAQAALTASGAATAAALPSRAWLDGVQSQELLRSAPRARYWTTVAQAGGNCGACHTSPPNPKAAVRHDPGTIRCLLCAQACNIKPGQSGKCRARANVDGELRSLVYGHPSAAHVDPIEKKPFYHFLPGTTALSFGTSGCPLRCRFCQNWELSQSTPGDLEAPYRAPAQLALAASTGGSASIAFTYNEPTVFAEYLLDVAQAAQARGVRSVMVSCGFTAEAPLADICRTLAAIKIDLKGFSEDFYRRVCGAELRPVLRSITQVAKSGRHLEIVNLVVPTLNDSDASLGRLVDWVAGELGPDVPLHFSRFYPQYQLLNLPPTPVATLARARELAMSRGIRYAYVGNVPGHAGNHTYCPGCKKAVIRRESFFVTENHVKNGACEYCKHAIAGVWT